MKMISATESPGRHDDTSGDPIENPSIPEVRAVTVTPQRFWLLSVGIYTGLFLSMMDASIVASSLHTIAIDFNVFVSVNWVALAYTLAECSCGVVFARISDIIGRRVAFVAAEVLFLTFSLACGFSQNLGQLVAFRAFQGVGGAGLCTLALVILPEVCPDHLLEYMAGFSGVSIVVACIVGPILGGILTQYATWRWIFWINGPICVTSMTIFLLSWPKAEDILPFTRRSWKSFDYVGSALLIAAAVLIVFAFQNVGVSVVDVWSSPVFISPIVAGVACWVALFTWQYVVEFRAAHHTMPTFPLSLFQNRFYASGVVTTLFLGFPLFMLLFSVPLRAQLVSGKSTIVAAVMLLPMLGASAMGCVVAVGINARKNLLSESMLVGASLSTLGCALLATVSDSGDDGKLLGYLVLAGLGGGLSITAATVVVAVEISPRDYAPAQGIMGQVRVLGGSLGISTSSVFLHHEVTKLGAGPLPPQPLALFGEPEVRLPSQLQSLVQQASSQAFRSGMIVSAAISGAAALLALIGYRRDHVEIKKQRLDLVRGDVHMRHTDKNQEQGLESP